MDGGSIVLKTVFQIVRSDNDKTGEDGKTMNVGPTLTSGAERRTILFTLTTDHMTRGRREERGRERQRGQLNIQGSN